MNITTGTDVCIDESLGKWIPLFNDTPEGISHLTKWIRKPVGIWSKYKCMADALSGNMLFFEYQNGKGSLERKK